VPLKTVTNYSRYFNKFDANDHRSRLEDAIKFVNSQIAELKRQITTADSEVNKLYDELTNKTG
jgi:septal ring factor EnvC (AmiA/AmiB activator)